MQVIALNPTYQDAERTYLTDPVSASATSLPAKSTANFSANQYVVVGPPGQEKTELRQISAVASVISLTVDALSYAHTTDDPIIFSRFNKIKIYRATSSSGSYTLIDTVDIQIDNPLGQTVYDDTTGTTSHYYKVSYYNSTSTLESAQSDAIPGTGYGRDTPAYIIDAVLEELGDKDEQVTTRSEILRWLSDCDEDVHSRRVKWEFWKESDTLTATADTATVALSGLTKTFDKLDHITYNYDDGATDETYRLREVNLVEYQRRNYDNDRDHDDQILRFALDATNDNILLDPIPDTTQTNKLTVVYYYYPTAYDSEGDTLNIPDRRVYHAYCMWRGHRKKQSKESVIDRWERDYERAVINLVRMNRRGSTQPRSMEYRAGGVRRFYKG